MKLQKLQLHQYTPRQQRWWQQQCALAAKQRRQEQQQFEEAVREDAGLLPGRCFCCQQQQEPQYGPHPPVQEEEEEGQAPGEQECAPGCGGSGGRRTAGCTVTMGAGGVCVGEQEVEQEGSSGSLEAWCAAVATAADVCTVAALDVEPEPLMFA